MRDNPTQRRKELAEKWMATPDKSNEIDWPSATSQSHMTDREAAALSTTALNSMYSERVVRVVIEIMEG